MEQSQGSKSSPVVVEAPSGSLQKQDLITTRPVTEGDLNFIYATMLRGLYYGDTWFSRMPKNIFMENYHKVVKALLSLPSTSVRVACLKEDHEVVLGYAVLGGNHILHYVFVKKAWRGIGIARSLVPTTASTASHLTDTGLAYIRKHPEMVFNPFALG